MERMVPGLVAVKLTSIPSNARTERFNLNSFAEVLEINTLKRNHPSLRTESSVLDGIYLVRISSNVSPIDFCNQLLKHREVVYAEPLFNEELFHTPDDPSAQIGTGNQGYLATIKAYEAWDITKGSSDIVIGIVDTGADLIHEDLSGKYYQNPGEAPIANGIDEDGNGYIDDILGFDFADDDNNPQADGNQHGTHVSGIAGAQTNNGKGIASVGYHTKIAPLKGFTTVGTLSTGVWEAFIYAADNGYDIVNLSWGSSGYQSQVLQDIITYCVLEKDMAVIGAAGNTNADLDFFPASYEHVLSVAGTTLTDVKWNNSTYGDHVDLTAPALSIYSTQNNNTYNSDNGTSHAAPQVAGVAALVKSVFPHFNARQIMEQIRVTTDNIYSVPGNETFAFKLGKGRLNAYRAVTESTSRSLRVQNLKYDNGFGQYAFYGDTLSLSFDFTNYLGGLFSPNVFLQSTSPYVTVLTSSLKPGAFATMQTKGIENVKILIDKNAPPNTELDLRFIMTEGGYSDFQNISIRTEPNEFVFGNNIVSLNVVGDGSIAYSDEAYTDGFDMEFENDPVMRFGGLLLSSNPSTVQDNVTSNFITNIRDDDFQGEKNLKIHASDLIEKIGYSEFSTKDGDLWVEQSILPSPSSGTILLSYRIINTSGNILSNLDVGFFADFFLNNPIENHAQWDSGLNALIFQDDPGNKFAALKVLGVPYHYMALDMQANNGNTRDVMDSFSTSDKLALLQGSNKPTAGTLGTGNDVAGFVSINQENVGIGDEVRFALVLTLGNNYTSIQDNLAEADNLIDSFLEHPRTTETFFSCGGNDVSINPSEGVHYAFYEDALGNTSLGTSEQIIVDNIVQDTSIFVRNLDGPFASDIRQIKIRIIDQVANFGSSTDTLYLDHPSINTVAFEDQSFRPTSWSWDFGNGAASSVQHPIVNYNTPGIYQVTLTVTSTIGCVDITTKNIVVADRPLPPSLPSISLCRNETTSLIHPTDEYVIYNMNGTRMNKGPTVEIGPFEQSTTLLISQIIGGFESLKTTVQIEVSDLTATYSLLPDLSASATQGFFSYTGSPATSIEWRIDGEVVSTNESFSYSVTGSPINLELYVANEFCDDILAEAISFTSSPIPDVPSYSICFNDDVTIKPTKGTYFGFYADEALSNLLLKAKELTIADLNQSQTVYVVGLDNILPSTPVAINISLLDFETDIVATPTLLDLSVNQSVVLSASNPNTISAKWYINDQLVDQTLSPILLFNSPGTYQLRLEAMNASGCQSTSIMAYTVVSKVTSLRNTDRIGVHPNPVKRGETITLDSNYDWARLVSLDGQVVSEFTARNGRAKIPTALKVGVYLLLTNSKGHTLATKLVIY
jgi:subtilisin family serine protease/PKD repeat protein